MKKKILITLAGLFSLTLVAAILIPVIYKDKIVQYVKDEANRNINAQLNFGEAELSLISTFPNLQLSLNDFSIAGIEEFEGDTLISTAKFSVVLDIISVLSGSTMEIRSLSIDNARLRFLVLKDGKANWDISKPSPDTATVEPASNFKMALKSFEINNGDLVYDDASMDLKLSLGELNTSGDGDFTQDIFTLHTNSDIQSANLWYGGVRYLDKAVTKLKADLEMNMAEMRFTFKENELQLNDLTLGMNGWVAMPAEDIDMDLQFALKQNEFKHFLSMIPAIYSKDFQSLKSSGTLGLNAFVKGRYNEKSMPGFGLALQVKNGNFQYPRLPLGVNNVQLDLNLNNPDGNPDHTLIQLSKLHLEFGKEPFDARLFVKTPVSDPDMNGSVKGRIDFSNIRKLIPLDAGTQLSGVLQADMEFSGKMSSIDAVQYEAFMAKGKISLSNMLYSTAADKSVMKINQCMLAFSPTKVSLENFDMQKGGSDLKASGTLENLLAYMFRDQALKGSVSMYSSRMNMADFQTSSDSISTASDTSALQMIEVPGNIDFNLNAEIKQLIYEDLSLSDLKGSLIIKEQAVSMNNLAFKLLGGAVKMSGSYSTAVRKKAEVQLQLAIESFDIQKTVAAFPITGKIAALAKHASGSFGTELNFNTTLDQHMQPDLNTLSGGGKLMTNNVVITNFKPFVKVSEILKLDQFKALPVSNINLSYQFEDGKVVVKPFDVTLGGIKSNVSGSSYFDQRIDYLLAMSIPTSKLPTAAGNAIASIISKANVPGTAFNAGENIPLNVKIGGTISDPTVKTELKDQVKSTIKDFEDKALQEIDARKKELEAKAKEEAERLKKEAEDKARSEAEKLKKAAEDKAKQEKERLKKEAEKKAKDALKNVFKKP